MKSTEKSATSRTKAAAKRKASANQTRSRGHHHGAPRGQVPLLLERFSAQETERISLGIFCPGASAVFVAGSFNHWQPSATPLQAQGDGRWEANLILKRGRYEYRFVVDDRWVDDPLSTAYVSNPFGGLNGVLVVGEVRA